MNLRIELEWRTVLATALLVPLLCYLGFWQLSRADEKRDLLTRLELRANEPALSLAAALREPGAELADRRVQFSAFADGNRYLLLDNRLRDGRFGYDVVALVDGDEFVLPLNLGWVPGDRSRLTLPQVMLPLALPDIEARIYIPSGEAFLLGENKLPDTLPAVVQQLLLEDWRTAIEARFEQPLFPFELRIDESSPFAFRADWPVVNQSPDKHTGYAVQWFTMAAVLFVAFLFRSSNLWDVLRGRAQRS